jgi:oligopeptide transport system substrate-binding protein
MHMIFRWSVLCIVLLFASILMVGCTTQDSGSKITISTVSLAPEKPSLNQAVTIGINVMNSGKKVESYSLVFKINDAQVDTKQINVGVGETQTISFQYTPAVSGVFKVDINGQTASFTVVKPAAFSVTDLTITPASPVLGGEVTAAFKVLNTGEQSGDYSAALKLDGQDVKTTTVKVDGGATQNVVLPFTVNAAGDHKVELAGSSAAFRVLKPADFKGVDLSISPNSALPGENVTVTAVVTNQGEVKAIRDIILTLGGKTAGSRSLTLEPGATDKVNFICSADTSGVQNLEVMGLTGSFSVASLSKYESKSYYYSVSYPPGYSVDEKKTYSVLIQNTDQEGLTIDISFVSVKQTLKENLAGYSAAQVKTYPDWNTSNQTEISVDQTVNGYKMNIAYTSKDKKYLGMAALVKQAGINYKVCFSVQDKNWPKYQKVISRCLDEFLTPRSFSGSYSNANLGIKFTLPDEWTATETGKTSSPIILYPPYNQNGPVAAIGIESIPAGVTAEQYANASISALITKGWTSGKGQSIKFKDGSTGYDKTISAVSGGTSTQMRFIVQIKDNRSAFFIWVGTDSVMNIFSTTISDLAATLVLSKPGAIEGVNRNEAVYLPQGEIATLDPALVETGPGDIIGAIFSGLVRLDTSMKIVPDLAESWAVTNNGLTYTFTLRKNAKFQDGRAVTAADVKYSWERACDPALKSPKASQFLADIKGANDRIAGKASTISGLKVINDNTLEVTLESAKAYFLGEMAQPVAFIVDKNDISRGAQWYEKPNGSGPFKIKTWQKDSLLVLERNDGYYLTPAKVKFLVFKLFAGNYMQLYENGEVDMVPIGTSSLDKVLDKTNPLNKELISGYSYNIDYLGMNVSKAPFDDLKIRQAVALALDVPKLVEISLKGQAQQAAGYIPPGVPGFNSALTPSTRNLEKAKQLIAESKYGSADKVPEITFYDPYGISAVDQAIIGMLQNLGLKVKSQVISSYDEYLKRAHNHELQLWTSGWRADYIDPQNFLEVLFQSKSSDNSFAYNNPAVDAALASAAVEQDPDKRIKMYQDIEKTILGDLPAAPLWCKSVSYVLVKPYLKGYAIYPMDINIWCELSITPH